CSPDTPPNDVSHPLLLHAPPPHPDLHSFPTRRSSDLTQRRAVARSTDAAYAPPCTFTATSTRGSLARSARMLVCVRVAEQQTSRQFAGLGRQQPTTRPLPFCCNNR